MTTMIHPNGINRCEDCSPLKAKELKRMGWHEETTAPVEILKFTEAANAKKVDEFIEGKIAATKPETITPDPIPAPPPAIETPLAFTPIANDVPGIEPEPVIKKKGNPNFKKKVR
jgi:hypothetical protein